MPERESRQTGARGSAIRWGLVLPLVGVAAVAALAIGYFFGWIGEGPIGMLGALVFAAALVVLVVRAGFESTRGGVRAAAIGYGLLCLFLTLQPTASVLMPGKPAASGVLAGAKGSLALPGPGDYRVVVSTPLFGENHVEYRLKVGGQDIDGTLERVSAYRRSRRGAAMQVTEEHNIQAHELKVSGASSTIELESLKGDTTGNGITVRAYPMLPGWLLWAAIGLALLAGMVLESQLLARGAIAGSGTAAGIFGLLITNASPASALGPVIGSALLGAGGGAIAGMILAAIGNSLFKKRGPAQEPPEKLRKPGERPAKGDTPLKRAAGGES